MAADIRRCDVTEAPQELRGFFIKKTVSDKRIKWYYTLGES